MAISVAKFNNSCLDVIRRVETTDNPYRSRGVARSWRVLRHHSKPSKVWVLSRGSNYGRWEASCWPSRVNRSYARRTSRLCVEFTARHAFLDLVAYPLITAAIGGTNCARCRQQKLERMPCCDHFMGSATAPQTVDALILGFFIIFARRADTPPPHDVRGCHDGYICCSRCR